MEVLVLVIIFIALPMFGYLLGKGSADGKVLTLKRENELLNQKLHRHNVRDSKGRFTGRK
jgi:multisubunit Na+/H+ antiporter MnhG subunit